jgi:hypothetical protein
MHYCSYVQKVGSGRDVITKNIEGAAGLIHGCSLVILSEAF